MPDQQAEIDYSKSIESIYRAESRRVFATLVRILGDFDVAEEALHDSFESALKQWPQTGIPANPRAWLISAGRFKGIDALRSRARFDASLAEISHRIDLTARDPTADDEEVFGDDRLRLIFICCHPALPRESHVPLTLREICGLSTEQIARTFLVSAPTIAQRIVRAKAKIKAAKIPYQIPSRQDLPDRLDGVMQVIYLIFTEGYAASFGQSVTRTELSGEAIRLGRLLMELVPEQEVVGLVALMLLQESRHAARSAANGDVILLEDQDRTLWDQDKIAEGVKLVEKAISSGRLGPYILQAAIAAVHAQAKNADQTDWSQIVALYGLLLRAEPSPIVELNRAVAIAMRDGPDAGLALIEQIVSRGDLVNYHLSHAARGELYRRSGKLADAKAAYAKALELVSQEPERRFLQDRLRSLQHPPS